MEDDIELDDDNNEKPWSEGSDAECERRLEDLANDEEPEAFDPGDWVNPSEARQQFAPSEENIRCSGDPPSDSNSQLVAAAGRDTTVMERQTRIRTYTECAENLSSLRDPIAASLSDTIKNAVHREKSGCMVSASTLLRCSPG